MKYRVRVGETDHEVEVTLLGGRSFQVTTGDRTYQVTLETSAEGEYTLQLEAESVNFYAQGPPSALELLLGGELFQVEVTGGGRTLPRRAPASGPFRVHAVMPGLVREVYVGEGQVVERGSRLLVLEAMKMNNEIRAPRAGVVQSVRVAPGQRVDKGEVMIVLSPES